MSDDEDPGFTDQLHDILTCYCSVMNTNISDIATKKIKFMIPIVNNQFLRQMIHKCQQQFEQEPNVLEIHSPLTVIGDLHGHLLDLLRILKLHHLPPIARYLFLGDFVDRGEFSSETLILVLTLKLLYPEDVFIIRGNHEFGSICDHYQFFSELQLTYRDSSLSELFINMFSYIPLAADIDNFIFAVHGGIGPSLLFIEQIRSLPKPLLDFELPLVQEILWSDPTTDTQTYGKSTRGLGVLFGQQSLMNFLDRTNFTFMVRGHQCVKAGCESILNHRVITVFSASNYCGDYENRAGILLVYPEGRYEYETFAPFQFLRRNEAEFTPIEEIKAMLRPNPRRNSRKLQRSPGQSMSNLPTTSLRPPPQRYSNPNNLLNSSRKKALAKIKMVESQEFSPLASPMKKKKVMFKPTQSSVF